MLQNVAKTVKDGCILLQQLNNTFQTPTTNRCVRAVERGQEYANDASKCTTEGHVKDVQSIKNSNLGRGDISKTSTWVSAFPPCK